MTVNDHDYISHPQDPPSTGINPLQSLIKNDDSTTPSEDQIPDDSNKLNSNIIIEIIKIISYDLILWIFNMIIRTFFRDIRSRGTFNIPKKGPIIFVIAPHHNQFVDPVIVMSIVREFARRRISFLIAAKSYRRKFIGTASRLCSAIPVERAQDLLKPVQGKIFIRNLQNDNEKDGELIVEGENTHFTKDCMEKGLIGLPKSLGNAQVDKIYSDTKLKLKKPFAITKDKSKQTARDEEKISLLTNGTTFKAAPHIDNNEVFRNVFHHLNAGKVLGIFPEGGSHDRTDLLPLKPGVAIMALGAAATETNETFQNINVIPVGLNYFHPHRFRSRVVLEFGKPIIVTKEDGEMYKKDSRKEVAKLLDLISLKLREVTVTCNDYDTLMAMQAARRLYTSSRRESIPLPLVVEMNRRIIKGYNKYANNPDVIELKKSVTDYNKKLMTLGLHDHQVEKINTTNRLGNLVTFSKRLFTVCLFFLLSLPGVLLFSPVFIISRLILKRKAKEALAGSVVKIKGNDVLGTWKILVAMVIAPMLYIFWSVCGTILINSMNILPNMSNLLKFIIFYLWSVLTTYSSLRIGEVGMDYYKSLTPLIYSILSAHLNIKQIEDLKKNRAVLAKKVTEFCDLYGPDTFEDYDKFYKVYNNQDYETDDEDNILLNKATDENNQTYKQLSQTQSFDLNNLADIPIFSNMNFLDSFTNHEEVHSDDSEDKEQEEQEDIVGGDSNKNDKAHLKQRINAVINKNRNHETSS